MFNGKIEVHINRRFDSRSVEVWVHSQNGAKLENYFHNEHGWLDSEIIDLARGEHFSKDIKPFLSVDYSLWEILSRAILDSLSKEGIKTKDENLIEGKLSATEKHLEDMRQITKHLLKMKEEQK